MPVVPHNTISEPAKVRAPDIFIARPRVAEAMGAVTSALGARAGAIGRNADVMGAIANEYGHQNAIRERTTLARVALNERMTDTLVGLGKGMMQTSMDIERIADRRADEEANQALTQFTNTLNMRTSGYTDPVTGQPVKGTYETPYAPADAKTEASGPSIATAKAVKEWYDDENGPYARLSGRAKQKFEQKAGGIYQTVMAKASDLEYKQIQAFRQENQKAAIESRRNLLMATHGSPGPNDTAFWTDAAMNAKELAAYGLESMARNPDGTYADPQAQRFYEDTQRDLVRQFAADRINTLFTKAQAEANDAVREEMLAAGINTAAYQMGGTHLFDEQEFADMKVKAADIKVGAMKRKIAVINASHEEARSLQDRLNVVQDEAQRGEITARLNSIRATLPPEINAELDQRQNNYLVARDKSVIAQATDQFEVDLANPATRANAMQRLNTFLVANVVTDEGKLAAQKALIAPRQRIGSENASLIATTGTKINPKTGQLEFMSDAEVTDYLVSQSGVSYDSAKLDDMMKLAAERKPEPAVREAIFKAIGEEIGADNLAESFKYEGGEFQQVRAPNDPNTGKINPGKVMGSRTAWLATRKGDEVKARKVDITARIVQQVAQAAYEYEQMPKTTGKARQKPPTLQEYIHGLLRPDQNALVRQLDEVTMQEHIQNMEAATQNMRDNYYKQIWKNRYPVQP